MGLLLRQATGREDVDEGCTDLGMPTAAVPEQEGHGLAEVPEVSAVDDRAALALGSDEARAREHVQVRGHRVVRHSQLPRDLARRHTVGLVFYNQAEGFEAR